jgi:hypothetical protein
VGINVVAPNQRLSVLDTQSGANLATAAIVNTNATDSTNTVALRLGLGVAATTTNGRFIQFYGADTTDNGGTAVGHININNNAVNYATSGADFAEYYNTAESVTAGDIVAYTAAGITKATTPNLLGVVSTTFGFSGNYQEGDETNASRAAVGLVGQVRTRVNGEHGSIAAGDPVALSSQAGVGAKATEAGTIVGYALESFDGTNSSASGTILVAIHPGYYDPTSSQNLQGNSSNPVLASLNVSGATTLNSLTVTGTASFHGDIVVGGHIITSGGQPSIIAQAVAGPGALATVTGNDTTGTITITTGSNPTTGELAKLVFSKMYGASPHVVLSPSNDAAAGLRFFKGTTTATNFVLNAKDPPIANTTYQFDYFIAE